MPGRLIAALALALAACGAPATDATRYLRDPEFRRDELAASLVEPHNAYSEIRLARYADWERLPEWNPAVDGAPLAIGDVARAGDPDALVALGTDAFFRYPAQALPRGVIAPRLVDVELADGSHQRAYTCATCHAAVRDGRVVPGLANAEIDLGRALGHPEWGPGRVDVATRDGSQPVRIPDLRPTRYLGYLQVNATVRQRNIASLALRIETLLVTARGEVVRPPREVSLGLALYLWSLSSGPRREPTTAAELRGRTAFDVACSRCHAPPSFEGPPVPLDAIGADAVGRSPERGTGRWRVPSLLGIADRGPLLHDGSLPNLEAVLDPARLTADPPVTKHRFGLEFDADLRADLVAYLRTL